MSIQCYEAKGDIDAAKGAARRTLERVEKVIIAEPDHGLAIGWGVVALVALREADRAKEWAARATLLDPENINLSYNVGCGMVSLGEMDAAIELLEPVFRVAEEPNMIWLRSDTSLDPIRQDPRFKALVDQAEARLAASR